MTWLARLVDATRVVGTIRALDGLNLEVHPGLTVLGGPSGAGKSTTLRVLAGIDPLTGGAVEVRAPVAWVLVAIGGQSDQAIASRRIHRPLRPLEVPTLVLADDLTFGAPRPMVPVLIAHLRTMADAGHAVVAASHNSELRDAADHVVELCGAGSLTYGDLVARA